jgi:Flp pilus assembly protein TadG
MTAAPARVPHWHLRGVGRWLFATASDNRGVAAVEFALVAGTLIFGLLNTVDIALYTYQRMEVQSAAQMAAQAAWKTCDVTQLPATTNCPGLYAALNAAAQASSLGNSVTLASGSPSEGYYCMNSSNALVYVSDVSSKPSDCSSVGNPTGKPGDYIQIQVSFTYASLFPGLSVASTLPSPVIAASRMRLQ